jgi:hypothetical protein
LVSLIISICGLPLYHVYEKQQYKIARIKYINTHPLEQMDGLIKFHVSSMDHLPIGYDWEDKGTEFIYNGMLYDVIHIVKSEIGLTITALADAPEISLDQKHIQLAQQQKESSSKSQQIFKWVFAPYIHIQKENKFILIYKTSPNFPTLQSNLVFTSIIKPYLPPKMN